MVGPSGCGKSTFLNIVSGIETPTSGSVAVTADDGSARAPRLRVPGSAPPSLAHRDRQPALRPQDKRTRNAPTSGVCRPGGTEGFEQMYPAHLSGGMQQRVGIARAFSVEPDLMLMDEPFSHLDAITARKLRQELQSIWERTNKTVLFVTHDVLEAVQLSNRIIIIGLRRQELRRYPDRPAVSAAADRPRRRDDAGRHPCGVRGHGAPPARARPPHRRAGGVDEDARGVAHAARPAPIRVSPRAPSRKAARRPRSPRRSM